MTSGLKEHYRQVRTGKTALGIWKYSQDFFARWTFQQCSILDAGWGKQFSHYCHSSIRRNGALSWGLTLSLNVKDLIHSWGLSQSVQLFSLFKIQDCIFTLSFVDKYTNTDFPFIGRFWYFLSQEIPEPPCLGIYHTSPPILSSPGSVTTRLEVSLKCFSLVTEDWEERLVYTCGNFGLRKTPCTGNMGHSLEASSSLAGDWLCLSGMSPQGTSDKVYLYHFNGRWLLTVQCWNFQIVY